MLDREIVAAIPTGGSPTAPSSGAGGAGDGATSPGPRVLRTGTAAASTAPAGPSGRPAPATAAAPSPGISAVVTGTLTVSPASVGLTLSLNGLWTGTLTLTAHGGPVSGYHVGVPVALLQDLTLSQASGSLADGQSVRITVTAVGAALFSTALLTVIPGASPSRSPISCSVSGQAAALVAAPARGGPGSWRPRPAGRGAGRLAACADRRRTRKIRGPG